MVFTTTVDYVMYTYNRRTTSANGPFLSRFRAPCKAPSFSHVGIRRCRPTFLGNVRRRGKRVGTVMRGPRRPDFRGAVITLSGDKRVLTHIDNIFFTLARTSAGSRVVTLRTGVTPVLSRRDSGVFLGRRLCGEITTIRTRRRTKGVRLAARRRCLLSGCCGRFIHSNTKLSTRGRRHLHRVGGRLSALAVRFNGRILTSGGSCLLIMSGGRSLTNLPSTIVTKTTRRTGTRKGSNG